MTKFIGNELKISLSFAPNVELYLSVAKIRILKTAIVSRKIAKNADWFLVKP